VWPDRLVLVAVFVVSRVAYGVGGLRFDASGLQFSSQLLDPDVLRDRLVESIWYLHAQPPAFNLFVGAVLRWSPFTAETSFQLAFLACGLVLLLALHDLARQLGIGRKTAIAVAVLIGCAPAVLLYENWLSYEYPVATMLVVLVDLVARYGRRPTTGLLVATMSVAALATLTRSLLHPLWLLALLVALLLYRWPPRRTTILYAALPLLVVVGVMAKNQILFGSPQLSSWFGFNIHRVALEQLTDAQKGELYLEGFRASEPPPCAVRRPDVPALADQYKFGGQPQDGEPVENFNYECVIDKYSALQRDSLSVMRSHPTWYGREVAGASEIWAIPSSLTPFVFFNREAIGPVDELYRRTALLDVSWDPPVAIPTAWPVEVSAPDHRFHVSITIVLATIAVSIAAAVALVRWRRRSAESLAMLVGGATVAYVFFASNLFEFGENNRFRFIVEPLTLVLFAALVVAGIRALRRRGRTSSGDDTDEVIDVDEPATPIIEPTAADPGGRRTEATVRPRSSSVSLASRRPRTAAVISLGLVALVAALVAACSRSSTDNGNATSSAAPATSATTAAPATTKAAPSTPTTVAVTGFDYEFGDLPDAIKAGSTLTFSNTSAKEAHELAVYQLPAGDTRSLQDLMAIAPDQLQTSFGGPPVMVLVAAPNAAGTLTKGDGTVATAGRYVAVCTVPTGADPQAYVNAAEQAKGGPVAVTGGPPHYMGGMIQIFTVT
jgi:hypothetical protein